MASLVKHMLDNFKGEPVGVELYDARCAEFTHALMTQSNLVDADTQGSFNRYVYRTELQCTDSCNVLPMMIYISEHEGRMHYNMEIEGQPHTYESYFFVF